ncbi:MAG: flagellar motor switch protein FliN [Actinomycetota bacterium]|nr:flagellar motor switch protein FliN [Actinomycetota bacterium]
MVKKSTDFDEKEVKDKQDLQNTNQTVSYANNEKSGSQSPEDNSIKKVQLESFDEARTVKENNTFEILKDVPLKLVVELGRTVLKISDFMELGIGSIIELDKLYGDPVDILVNNKLIGKGEVVVIDEDFAIRITEINTKTGAGN